MEKDPRDNPANYDPSGQYIGPVVPALSVPTEDVKTKDPQPSN